MRNPEFMDRRSIVLSRQEVLDGPTHPRRLVATLGEKAIAYSTMTKYLREVQTSPDEATPSSDAISCHTDNSDEAILRALEKLPFSSVRQLSHATHLPKATASMRLSEKLWFTARHFRWVPHIGLRIRHNYACNVQSLF
jgi:hypothetical protein